MNSFERSTVKRIAQVIGVKPEKFDEYATLHQSIPQAVAEHIQACNYRNYSIFHWNGLLFSYLEYVGDDFDADQAKMAAHKPTQDWWDVVGPMQEPVEGRQDGEWWAEIAEVFHQE